MKTLQIHIFDFAKDSLEHLEKLSKSILEEETLLEKKKKPLTYRSFLGGRAALNLLLQKNGLDFRVVPHPEFGFLQLSSRSGEVSKNWYCNISHTESFAVAAISNCPVGVDVEQKDRAIQKVLTRIVSESELKEFNKAVFPLKKEIQNPHLLLWTGKEAFSKAIGLGLRSGLKDFFIDWKSEQPLSGTTSISGPLTLENPALSFSLQNKFLVSICHEKGLKPFYFS
jgi:4'-phosphopantetheinyl transferase EntD